MSRTEPLLLALLVGCGPGRGGEQAAIGIDDVIATVSSDVPTVVTVSWTTSEPTTGRVRFGLDGALDRSTLETSSGTEHVAVLLGLPAERDVSYQVLSDEGEAEPGEIRTGALSTEIPGVSVTGENDAYLLTSLPGTPNLIVMFDPDGNVVWWHVDARGLSVFRARVAPDGSGIVYSSAIVDGGPSPDSLLVHVPWEGGAETTVAVPNLAHDFVTLDDGTIVTLGYDTRDGVQGNDLLSVGEDGATTELWSTWDCFDPATNPGDDPAHGWTHANALDDAGDGTFYVGLRNLGTIAKVDPATRSCPWTFGGAVGTVDIDGPAFIHQHQFAHADDRMLVFDNDGAPGNESQVVVYDFDEAAGTAVLSDTLRADPPLYSFIMGDVHALPAEDDVTEGDTLIVWSIPGIIERVDATGAPVWTLAVDGGGPFGFVQVLASPYAP